MTFRVTSQYMIGQGLGFARNHNRTLSRLQQQASTGLRIQRPSDDPAAMSRALTLKLNDARLEAELTSIAHVRSTLNQTVSHLTEANSIMTRARQIAIDATQPDAGALREVNAREVDALIERLLSLANTRDGNRFVFGGTRSDTPPFVTENTPAGDRVASVRYVGTDQSAFVPVGQRQRFEMFQPGRDVFQSTDRQPSTIHGATGAKSSGLADSGVGAGTLAVRHVSTIYPPESGVKPGVESAERDTIIGPAGAWTLTVEDTSGSGAAGTVSLNGGPVANFTSADNTLQVRGPGGEVVLIDTTSIVPGFTGTIDITATGTLSTDNGQTEVPIDFTNTQIVTDSQSGHTTAVDTQGIRRAGSDRIEYTGTFDVFSTLISLRDELLAAGSDSTAEIQSAFAFRANDVERHGNHLLDVVGEHAATLETLEALENRTQDLQLEGQLALSNVEAADLAEVAVGLQSEQNLLQMTYASMARVIDQSLLDFIR